MQYMITFNHTEGVWDGLSAEEKHQHGEDLQRFIADLRKKKKASLVFLGPERKTVRKHDDGRMTVSNDPAIPGPEQMGGYFIIDVESVDEAIDWAKRGRWLVGSNEILPIVDIT